LLLLISVAAVDGRQLGAHHQRKTNAKTFAEFLLLIV